MAESNASTKGLKPRALNAAILLCSVAAFSFHAAEQARLSLDDQEQLDVQSDLFWLTATMWVLVIGLLVFAYSVRYIAKRNTHPCHWCSEFIPNTAVTCPRCGKKAERVTAVAPAGAKPA